MRALIYVVTIWVALATALSAQQQDRQIVVSGEGRVDVVPDMAMVTLGVTHEAKVASEAMRQTSEGVAAILERLEGLGIAARDVQTSGLSLNPVWSNRYSGTTDQRPEISGFVAQNAVTVRVRALDGLGAVLDAVIADGANTLNGLDFGVQEPGPLLDEARRRAVADAIARATLLADAAGVALGPLMSLSETGGRSQPMKMEMAMARDAGVPVAAGEVGIVAGVSMVFAIAD